MYDYTNQELRYSLNYMATYRRINVASLFVTKLYSQLELRLQCEWTNLINGTPDINMARAFMPYKCIEKNGKYYLEESPDTEWTPTDLHGMTAKSAFPGIDESHPDWKHYRTLGKRCNFA